MSRSTVFEPKDELQLWWVADSTPVWIGELRFVRALRGVSLLYGESWLERGFALSEDLPLLGGQEFLPTEKDSAVGAVDDARPDRWGERVIRFIDKPARLSLMEYLYFAGDDRFGALGVSLSREQYSPRRLGPLPHLRDAAALQDVVHRVLAGEPIEEPLRRLLAPGVTLGGARPKALIEIDGEPWVIKFADGDPIDTPLVEHASMTLAAKAGIRVAETRAIPLPMGHGLGIKRFDRTPNGRVHALSAHVALRAAGVPMSYPELAQLLRRRGPVANGTSRQQMQELFRRMVFNILIDNTDDHEKNHALLVDDRTQYELSPAYDVLPSGQALGYQQMSIGEEGADSTVTNALSVAELFGLTAAQGRVEVARVATTIDNWKTHFIAAGVRAHDIEQLSEQIDRPFLRDQRTAFKM